MKNEKMIDQVKTMRDELKVKAHLMKMDAQEQWQDLEKQYKTAIGKIDKAKATFGEVTDDVWAANKLAFKKMKDGYEQIKEDLN